MTAFICDYVRTPIGRFGGSLSSVRTDDLGAVPIKALMARHPGINWAEVDEVIDTLVGLKRLGQFQGFWSSFTDHPRLAQRGALAQSIFSPGVSHLRAKGHAVTVSTPLEGCRGWHADLCLSAAASVLVADLSRMSKSEVERIWLPFVPWLLISTALLPQRWRRAGLALQLVTALVAQHLLYTSW